MGPKARRSIPAARMAGLALFLAAATALPGPARAADGPWGVTREAGVTVYQQPDAASHPLARVVRTGGRLELLQGEGDWYKVRVGSAEGWVPTEQVRVDFSAWQEATLAAAKATPATAPAAVPGSEIPPGVEAQVPVQPPAVASVANATARVVVAALPTAAAPPAEPPAEHRVPPKAETAPPFPSPSPAAAVPSEQPNIEEVSPSAPAPAATEPPAGSLRGRWRAGGVLGYGFLDQAADATVGGTTSTLNLDRHRYLGVRLGYGVTEWLELEVGAAYDWYRWSVENSLSANKGSEFSSITLTGGPLVYSPRRRYGWLGTGAFFAQAALAYRVPNADLDFPVRDYDPAFGAQLAVGYEWRALQLRLGYSLFRHAAGNTEPSATLSGDADLLDLSEAFVDLTWSWGSEAIVNGQ